MFSDAANLRNFLAIARAYCSGAVPSAASLIPLISFTVVMKFKNGTMAYHFGTWGAKGTFHGYTFHVLTDKGMFQYHDGTHTLTFDNSLDFDYASRQKKTWYLSSTAGHATWRAFKHFVECINEHKVPLTNGRRALRSLDVIWKVYEAEEKMEIADFSDLIQLKTER